MNYEFREFFVFQIGAVNLGLKMDVVEEVLNKSVITPIPRTASFVRGLAAVRGKIMSVIDGSLRLGISSKGCNQFVICHVRGNLTAVMIERPIEAGNLCVRKLSEKEEKLLYERWKLNSRLFQGAWQIFEKQGSDWIATQRHFLELVADQFVSDQMASQLLRA